MLLVRSRKPHSHIHRISIRYIHPHYQHSRRCQEGICHALELGFLARVAAASVTARLVCPTLFARLSQKVLAHTVCDVREVAFSTAVPSHQR